MGQKEVITEATIDAALAALEKRIAVPPPPEARRYSRREAFLRLRAKAREALAAGHSLETVLDDLKGVGLGMTLSTARQYLKPGRKTSGNKASQRIEPERKQAARPASRPAVMPVAESGETKKGTFTVVDDDNDI